MGTDFDMFEPDLSRISQLRAEQYMRMLRRRQLTPNIGCLEKQNGERSDLVAWNSIQGLYSMRPGRSAPHPCFCRCFPALNWKRTLRHTSPAKFLLSRVYGDCACP